MFGNTLTRGFNKDRLRVLLIVFFVALSVPTLALILKAHSQLKWEAFHQHRVMAEELVDRIDRRLIDLVGLEESRSFADYAFLNIAGDATQNIIQRSPLSNYPVESGIPGVIGYFQVDTNGKFSTPLLPPGATSSGSFGITASEYAQRLAVQTEILQVLSANSLVLEGDVESREYKASQAKTNDEADGAEPARKAELERRLRASGRTDSDNAPASSGEPLDDFISLSSFEAEEESNEGLVSQSGFDALINKQETAGDELDQIYNNKLGRVSDLKIKDSYKTLGGKYDEERQQAASEKAAFVKKRSMRKEQGLVPESTNQPARDRLGTGSALYNVRISTFESEIDPFSFSLLESGHFVLFRNVWRDGKRFTQGAIIDQQAFIDSLVADAFRETALSSMSDLIVAFRGNVLAAFSGDETAKSRSRSDTLTGSLLYQASLSAPLGDVNLISTIQKLPSGPGGTLINWITLVLVIVLCGGFYVMYRLGIGQIDLARQQQDFVSAVSHELKTPLTSIRMYGEMLLEGWADEERKKTYYGFIHDESERLSRLIANVLQLARLTRNDPQFDLKETTVAELCDLIVSKISSQVKRAGFALDIDKDHELGDAVVLVDTDCFTQIVINLVDNAIKFSQNAKEMRVAISCRQKRNGFFEFSVRDYGPGIHKDQMKKIFRLFYRPESELTRETIGTGIGLALVHQLVLAMDGQIDVCNREPGAEFTVVFPVISTT